MIFSPRELNSVEWDFHRPFQPNTGPFTCGHCGVLNHALTAIGSTVELGSIRADYSHILICGFCKLPNCYLPDHTRFPAPRVCRTVLHVPIDVNALYKEAQDCHSVNAFFAVAAVCRQLILAAAIDKGFDKNGSFEAAEQFIYENDYIPQATRENLGVIRKIGNHAIHRSDFCQEDSELALSFCEQLLINMFESPEKAKLFKEKKADKSRSGG